MERNKEGHKSRVGLKIEPLTTGNWDEFVRLFGEKGACGNCWCMYYRLSNSAFHDGKSGEGNKNAMKALVRDGKPAGLIGYIEGNPVAWCAFAPREDFIKLEKSRVHKRIDDMTVWSIPCLFIHKKFRGSGISSELLKGAIDYAGKNGIKVLEAYPVIPTTDKMPDAFAWTGLLKSFEHAGFEIVDRTSKNRPMVRYYIEGADTKLTSQ